MSIFGCQTLVNLSIRTRILCTLRNGLISFSTSASSQGEDKGGGTSSETKTIDKTTKKLRAKTPIGKMEYFYSLG